MSVYEKVGGEFAVNSETAGDQTTPQITTFADGGFLVTWLDREPWPDSGQVIKAQLYDASGARAGAEFQVNELSTDGVFSQTAAVLADGTVVVTWINSDYSEDGPGGVRARMYDSAGNALGGEFGVNATHESYKFNSEIAALSGGGFVVTWDDSAAGSQMAQVFDASGAKVGAEFATTTSLGYDGGYGDVVGLAGGGFVTSWYASDGDVYARLFDDSGAALGGAFKLNSLTGDSQHTPSLTALVGGGFVAVWQTWDSSQDGSSGAIKGQVFDASGAKVGSEFLANQYGANLQSSATVTALPDGAFLVAWATYDWSQDGDGSAVKVRQFNADGTAAGGETLLNTVTAGGQFLPELATLSDGRIVAAWVGDGTDGDGYGIRAQFLYTSANAAPQITSDGGGAAAGFTLAENATAVTTVAAGDADGPQAVTYWIGGGADAALFAIDKTTGALSFVAGPDFESPADADEDGVYQVIVEARDGLSVDTQAITVAVTDLADGLSFRHTSLTALENGLAGPTLLALGGDGAPVSYAIVGGADAALLALDAQTGELSFLAEQDREAPGDADGDGVYEVEVTADDGTSSVTRTISVALGNVNEGQVFLSATEWTVAENEYLAATVLATDVDGDELEYIVTGGADGALFGIGSEGLLGFNEPADFEAPADADGDNVYEVEVTAYDGDLYTTQLLTITVTDAEDPLPLSFVRTAFEVSEIVTFSAALELTGDSGEVYYSIVGGADGWLFDIDSYTGELTQIFGAFDYESPYDSDGDNLYEVEVEAYDYNSEDTVTGTVTVAVRDAVNEELFFVTDDDWAATENETYVGAVLAYDAQYDALTYTIAGGADAALFTLDAYSGELSFLTAPDSEFPGDAGSDNVYDIELAVSDGQTTEYQTVTVTVGEPEPEAPSPFVQAEFAVDENTDLSVGLELIDPDPAYTAFWITGGADSDYFLIDSGTGELSFSGDDFEAWADADGDNVFEVEVTASGGGDDVTGTVRVTLQDVDEAPDVMSWPISINENSLNGGWVYAWDPENQPLTYAIAGGADGGLFTIDSNTGFLRFTSAADFEAPADAGGNNVYDLIVEVSDGSLSTTAALTVTVQNVGEAPVITSNGGGASASLTVNENAAAVTTVAASDPESGVTYSLVAGGDAARFAINASTGALTFVAAPDYEAPTDGGANNVYNVTVRASDGSLTDTQALAITVANLNETPVITSNGGGASAAISVSENATAVSTVTSTDPDGGTRTYSLAGGADAALFAIDSVTGALSFLAAPNFEAPADAGANNVYEVVVRASDGSLSDTQTLSVAVGDVNEAPVITSNGGGGSAALSVNENSASVATVAASAEGGVTYSLAGGADAALFAIDSVTGALSFLAAPNFEAPADADGDNVYEVVVSASDGSLSDTQSLAISVGNVDEAPAITSNGGGAAAALTIGENATAVTAVTADDPEGGVTYALAGGADAGLFAIDAGTGALSLLAAPNFEAPGDADGDNVYDVVVSASDGTGSDSQALSVTVADVNEAPVVLTGEDSLNENSTFVGTVWAGDPEDDMLTYSLVGGADRMKFRIDGSDGGLSFWAPQDFEAPGDADGDNVYEVVVGVSDGNLMTTRTVAVTVNNLNEAPDIISGDVSIDVAASENSTVVTTVVAIDPEGGVTYSLQSGADSARFAIGASTGVLSFVTPPDFEAPTDANGDNEYSVVVLASDGTLSAFQIIHVTVGNTNEAPVIASNGGGASAALSVDENTSAITAVAASDPEGGVTYAIAGGADAARFAIDASTGALSFVAAPDHEVPSDADANNVYDVVVSASDGTLLDTQALSITVGNVNEAPTIVSDGAGTSAALELDEGQTAVTTVVAADPDGPGATAYAITGGPDAALFAIDAATGALTLVEAPDYEAPADQAADNFYTVTVTATDGELSTFQTISVLISDVNEGVTITSAPSAAVVENATAVATVTATDLDGDAVAFALAGGADAALFAIDASTGALSFVTAPDFEAPADANGDNVYEVLVSASDGNLSDTQSLAVTVGNLNEAPVIASNGGGASAALAVSENSTGATTVVAGDAEGGVTYALAGGADAALFELNAETGALSFLAAPNHEAPGDADGDNVYEVIVGANDGDLGDTQALSIAVGDVNEGLSITSPAEAVMAENETLAATVTAEDLDGDAASFAITGGTDAALFELDAETGALTFIATPDFEAPGDADGDNVYDLMVSASDGSLSDTQTLAITVGNLNEAPVITSNGSGASAAVSTSENTIAVTTVAAADPEGGVTYSLAGGADAARFVINASTGALSFVTAPNFEAPTDANGNNVYEVVVSASDGSLTDTQALSVTVGNVNEAPMITSGGGGTSAGYALNENATAVATVAATDAEGGVTYALVGGADAARFTINASTGALSFVAAPDFDAPTDAGGNNVYDVIVSASDGSLVDTQALAITVGNVSDGLTLTGTQQANTLNGSYEEDTISGLGGNDTLRGLGAADVLNGGDGQDRLYGGAGADMLTGGLKADIFELEALGDSTLAASDRILDFTRSQGDKIELLDIDANAVIAGNQAFSFIGTAAFSNQAGQLRYFQQNGDTFVAGDVDGNGAADFQIVVDPLVSFIASDFIL